MGKRPAHCYTKIRGPANTRTKKYVRGVPGNKIVMYDMGNKSKNFSVEFHLVNEEACQIRHMAIEAARQAVNRYLTKALGRDNYHFRVRIHPHHVLRENKMMAFAGADRMQDGMRRSFGKPADRSARVKSNTEILTVRVEPRHHKQAAIALKKGVSKFPTPAKVVLGKGQELI
ncbi:MAG: 50S ribosomal protein L16 [Candidatus Heimdallarchaeota archaeon]|nr:50S ribosomal protein L16 [Candidatus Heimdallarchaeota archaeon]